MPDAFRTRLLSADAIVLMAITGLAGAGAWRATQYKLWDFEPGAGLFPFIICLCVVVFSLLALAARLSGQVADKPADPDDATHEGPVLWGKLVTYVAVILIWPWIMSPLGFLVSTGLALLVLARVAERMNWLQTALMAAGSVSACWLVFERLLGVALPRGVIGLH